MNNGAILAWLIEKGYTVFGIQPKSAQRARDIYRPSDGKDDPVDTFVLVEMVRLSPDRLRPLRPNSPVTEELRELLRWRQELVHQRTAATRRLRAVLAKWSPRLSELCDDLSDPTNNVTERIIGLTFKIPNKTMRGFKSQREVLDLAYLSSFLCGERGSSDLRKVI